MNHHTNHRFWEAFRELPVEVQTLAKKSYRLMVREPKHPSVHLKKVGQFWSARIGLDHRAVAREVDDGLLWFWIGPHDEYNRLVRRSGPPARP